MTLMVTAACVVRNDLLSVGWLKMVSRVICEEKASFLGNNGTVVKLTIQRNIDLERRTNKEIRVS